MPQDPEYVHVSPEQAIARIHQVSKKVKLADLQGVLDYIQFVAIEALTEAHAKVTPYSHVGTPPPPCPNCPPGKP